MIKGPMFLAVVLLLSTFVAVGYQAFEMNKVRLGEAGSVGKAMQVTEPQKKTTAENYIPDLAQLSKRDLMGNPAKPVAKVSAEKAIPITTLKLTLIGTISKSEGARSSALIQGSNRETKRYFVGEMVEAGFILDSVAVNSVVLKRGEQLETLQYPDSNSNASIAQSTAPAAATPVAGRPAQQNAAVTGKQAVNTNNNVNSGNAGNNNMISLRDRLRRARANNNPPQNSAGNQ